MFDHSGLHGLSCIFKCRKTLSILSRLNGVSWHAILDDYQKSDFWVEE